MPPAGLIGGAPAGVVELRENIAFVGVDTPALGALIVGALLELAPPLKGESEEEMSPWQIGVYRRTLEGVQESIWKEVREEITPQPQLKKLNRQ